MSNKYPGGIITSGANAGYSVFFDGSGDYLNLGGQSAFAFGTGDFTIEMWVYLNSTTGELFDFRPLTTNGLYPCAYITSGSIRYFVNNADQITSGTTVTTGTWYHIAVCRSGTSTKLFLNGAQTGSTYTDSNNYICGASRPAIGINGYDGTNLPLSGYMSNVRVLKGTALYTAAFTPPTQLFNITNTSLLTCNSPAIVDQSSNAFTITANGDAKVSTFTPFTGYIAYNPALGAATPGVWTITDALQAAQTRRWNMYDPYFNNTTLLLHGNGTNGAQNNTFLDSSSNNFTITRNGNTTQGTFSPFSQTGWGVYFDGSSYIAQTTSTTDFNLSTGDWTIEFWVYKTAASDGSIVNLYNTAANTSGLSIWINSSGVVKVDNGVAGAITTGGTVSFNTWAHLAIVRASGTTTLYVNGVSSATTTQAPNTAQYARFGQAADGTLTNTAYVSNLRLVKGTAVYTSNFTPSTSPLTAITNTKLLVFQSNRFIDNSTNAFSLTTTGTPSVQAFSPFLTNVAYTPTNQGGSGYFDGSGDYLNAASNAAFAFGTGSFTWETWFYSTGAVNRDACFYDLGAANTTGGFAVFTTGSILYVRIDGANDLTYSLSTIGSGWLNSWHHLAVVRNGTTLTIYLDGVSVASGTRSQNVTQSSPYIGNSVGVLSAYPFLGYLSNMRVVKGTAVYTAAFTPPTAPLTAITNTSLLLSATNAGIVDSTAKNVLETVGNAQISTTQSKFGGSSLYFDGTGDYLQIPDSNLFPAGTEDFTIEFWAYFNATGTRYLAGQCDSSGTLGSQSATILKTSGEKLQFYCVNSSTQYTCTSTNNLPQTTWTHIACVRNGGTLTQYINGVADGTASISTNAINNSSNRFGVGTLGEITTSTMNGYIADFRITKGVARYTGNFTVQTSQWQDQ